MAATIRRGREMRLYLDGALAGSLILDPSTQDYSFDGDSALKIGSNPVGAQRNCDRVADEIGRASCRERV